MTRLDLDAPILAGISAAGLKLGMNASSVAPLLTAANWSERYPTPINAQLATGQTFVIANAARKIRSVFFGEQLRLSFNTSEELFAIWIYEPYRGLYMSKFGIGTPMRDIDHAHPLEFDDGDEVFYVERNLANGISFLGNCCSLSADPDQLVSGMCVHDWTMAT